MLYREGVIYHVIYIVNSYNLQYSYMYIWNLGTPEFRYDFTMFFIYMNSYMNS